MELLGQSLENLFQAQNKSFSIKTACMLGIQMIDRIEYIHSRKIIHRDIKPDNFVMGRGLKSHIVYVLDFGLSKKYWSSSHKCHIPYCTGKKLTGTARYASINALSGYEQSRRDDLESIGYIIMYFIRGSLPWQGLKINKKDDRYKKICEKKRDTSAKDLCSGFPHEFETFVQYTRDLKFTELPNYDYLRDLLKTIIKKSDYKIEYNGSHEWLNNNSSKNNEMEESENHVEYKHNKVSSNINNSHAVKGSHHRVASNNLSTKCMDSESKKNLPFTSGKK